MEIAAQVLKIGPSFRIAGASLSAVLPIPQSSRPPEATTATPPGPRPLLRGQWMDSAFENLTRFFALVVFSLLAAILISLVIGSQLTLHKYGFNFLWSAEWDPVKEEFGALVPIY